MNEISAVFLKQKLNSKKAQTIYQKLRVSNATIQGDCKALKKFLTKTLNYY
ncbi:MAG: HTH domain-containing protein [Candidatus Bathyarchaeota archaeon]|nr:HTH domain-containing protein [Candidatus Bathyarchaeum sp.]